MSAGEAAPGLYARKVQHDFHWRLRLTHPDRAEVRVEWKGRPVVFDPVEVQPGDLVVLTGADADRTRGTAAAVAAGVAPDVVADPALLEHLKGLGALGAASCSGGTIDGLTLRAIPYPAPAARPLPQRLRAGALRPRAAIESLRARAGRPDVAPRVWELTLPDGGRLVHADLCLHRDTPAAFLDTLGAMAGADWVLIGCPYGEADAVAAHAHRLEGRQVLVTELVNGERRARGLPCEGVTLLRDRLHAAGLPAHVFATQASYRFE